MIAVHTGSSQPMTRLMIVQEAVSVITGLEQQLRGTTPPHLATCDASTSAVHGQELEEEIQSACGILCIHNISMTTCLMLRLICMIYCVKCICMQEVDLHENWLCTWSWYLARAACVRQIYGLDVNDNYHMKIIYGAVTWNFQNYRKTSDRSRAPDRRWALHTGRGSDSLVLIEAGGLEAGGFYPKFYGISSLRIM